MHIKLIQAQGALLGWTVFPPYSWEQLDENLNLQKNDEGFVVSVEGGSVKDARVVVERLDLVQRCKGTKKNSDSEVQEKPKKINKD